MFFVFVLLRFCVFCLCFYLPHVSSARKASGLRPLICLCALSIINHLLRRCTLSLHNSALSSCNLSTATLLSLSRALLAARTREHDAVVADIAEQAGSSGILVAAQTRLHKDTKRLRDGRTQRARAEEDDVLHLAARLVILPVHHVLDVVEVVEGMAQHRVQRLQPARAVVAPRHTQTRVMRDVAAGRGIKARAVQRRRIEERHSRCQMTRLAGALHIGISPEDEILLLSGKAIGRHPGLGLEAWKLGKKAGKEGSRLNRVFVVFLWDSFYIEYVPTCQFFPFLKEYWLYHLQKSSIIRIFTIHWLHLQTQLHAP